MLTKSFTFDGKRHFVRAKTPEELAVKLYKKKRDLEDGKVALSGNMTVKKWAETFLEEYKAPTLKGRRSYETYKYRVDLILSDIGHMSMRSVYPLHCQRILNKLDGKSQSHIDKVYQVLRQMFRAAKRNRIIATDPTEDLVKPKGSKGTHRAITQEERRWTLVVADKHKSGLWVLIMLYCGLRPEETTLIQGKHIQGDLLKIPGTKNENAVRTVPIPSVLREKLPALAPDEFLFKNNSAAGKLTDSGRVALWKAFKRQMNIEMGCKVYRNQLMPINLFEVEKGEKPKYKVADDLTPYCYRHTYCTDLQTAGVPINVAKELMGHSDISLTANIYTHFSDTSFKAAQNAIESYAQKSHKKSHLKSPKHTKVHFKKAELEKYVVKKIKNKCL
ncbi:MAG: tyrosine-type recombinase/integrase [Eubacteriales bacterium]|nr:tyrosine-type recombinase/integrase [Eubacteriales bacterium]